MIHRRFLMRFGAVFFVSLMVPVHGVPGASGDEAQAPSPGDIRHVEYAEVVKVIELQPAPFRAYQREFRRMVSERYDLAETISNLEERVEELQQLPRSERRAAIGPVMRDLRRARGDYNRLDRMIDRRSDSLGLAGGVQIIHFWDGFRHEQVTAFHIFHERRAPTRFRTGEIYKVQGRQYVIEPDEDDEDDGDDEDNEQETDQKSNELTEFERVRAPRGFWRASDRDDLLVPGVEEASSHQIVTAEVNGSSDPRSSRIEIMVHCHEDDPARVDVNLYANDADGTPDELLTDDGPLTLSRLPGYGRKFQARFDPGRRHPFGYTAVVERVLVWRWVAFDR